MPYVREPSEGGRESQVRGTDRRPKHPADAVAEAIVDDGHNIAFLVGASGKVVFKVVDEIANHLLARCTRIPR